MTTAIIGVGNIGGALARHLVRGGEQVVLAAREESNAAALAGELAPLASVATVQEAIERLITVSGFDPVRAGHVSDVGRIEVPGGDLHQGGGLGGKLLDTDQARAAVAAA